MLVFVILTAVIWAVGRDLSLASTFPFLCLHSLGKYMGSARRPPMNLSLRCLTINHRHVALGLFTQNRSGTFSLSYAILSYVPKNVPSVASSRSSSHSQALSADSSDISGYSAIDSHSSIAPWKAQSWRRCPRGFVRMRCQGYNFFD